MIARSIVRPTVNSIIANRPTFSEMVGAGGVLFLPDQHRVYSDAGTTPADFGDTVQQWSAAHGGVSATQGTAANRMALGRAAVGVAPSATLDGGAGPAFLRDDLANDGYSVTPSENYTYALIAARQQSVLFPVDMPASTAATVGVWAGGASILLGIEDVIGYTSGAAAGSADHVGWCFFTERPSNAALRGIMASVLAPRGAGPLIVPSDTELWADPPETIGGSWTDNGGGSYTSDGTADDFLRSDDILTPGSTYMATVRLDARTSGTLGLPYDGSGGNLLKRAAPQFYTRIFTAANDFALVYSDNLVGTVSEISLRELVAL